MMHTYFILFLGQLTSDNKPFNSTFIFAQNLVSYFIKFNAAIVKIKGQVEISLVKIKRPYSYILFYRFFFLLVLL